MPWACAEAWWERCAEYLWEVEGWQGEGGGAEAKLGLRFSPSHQSVSNNQSVCVTQLHSWTGL